MATIQIRNLPDETVREFKVRAAKAGKSLQEYMLGYLIEEASRPTLEELIERLEHKSHQLSARGEARDLPLDETAKAIDETWD